MRQAGLLIGLAVGVYLSVVRRRILAWGSTVDERTGPRPGDEFVPDPTDSTTRAITIDAPPDNVWPWLVQIGQDRAGFYTHNWVERLLGSGIPDVHVIHPEWQRLAPGELVRTNRDIRGKSVGWPVLLVETNRSLVLRSNSLPSGTYAFVLEPTSGGGTRFLVRDRAVWPWWQRPFQWLIFEPLHAYMESGVLQGIKARAGARVRTG
jgi:uncharacterized protein YndB with AHSA1/START domain